MSQSKALHRDKHLTRFIHRLFFRAMLQDKKNLAVSLLHFPSFVIINAYIPLQVAYILQAIFQQRFNDVQQYVVLIVLSGFIGGMAMYLANQADPRMGLNGARYLQRVAYKNFLDKDYEFYSNQFVGSIGAQVSNLRESFVQYVHEFKFVIEKNLAIVLSILFVLAINSWQLFLLSIVIIFIIVGYTIIANKKRMVLRRASSEASNDLTGVEADAISHGAAVKSFAAEDYELDYSAKTAEKWQKAQLKTWLSLEPSNTIRVIINQISIAVLLLITAILYKNGDISIAIVILVQLYMFRLINVTLDIAEIIKQYEHIMGMAYKPAITMQIEKQITDLVSPKKLPNSPKLVEFQEVTFNYGENTNVNVVDTFSLKIKSGERVGLIGHSGAGKTTITKLILRFMDISSGVIMIDGIDIKEVAQKDLRQKISYVPQEPLLFHRSIRDNIAYGKPDASDEEIKQAARLAFVDEFVLQMPSGYETLVGERGVKLSGGQRQRVAIARAILKDAPILVLDEATSALDSQSEKYIQDALWKLMKGRTALVIAHRLSTIQRMEKIVVMDKGKIAEIGSHSQLLKQKGIYADLWQHQSGGYLPSN